VIILLKVEESKEMCAHISKQDSRLDVEEIKYRGETGEVLAHLAKPKRTEKLPGVVVIHENRGLNPHTEDVARRLALEGFLAMAPNALSPFGGTPDNVDEARTLMSKLDSKKTVKNFVAAVKYLKTHPNSTGKVGVTGFCWGGGVTNQVAVNSQDVQAAVPFYGRQPEPEKVSKIQASLLIHYAGDDERINAGIPEFEAALNKSSIEYKIYMYDGAKHAFFNDTGPRYHMEASKLAWERTIAFFKDKLKT
jgi:carboxymethylenebutenolidase